jgi:hypothetical protein
MQELLLRAVRVCASGRWNPEKGGMTSMLLPYIRVTKRLEFEANIGFGGRSGMKTIPEVGQINEELDGGEQHSEAESWRKILDAPKAAVPDKLRPKFERMCLEYNFKRAKRFATPELKAYLEDIRDS